MKKQDLPLPPQGSSMALAVLRLEEISNAIQRSVTKKKARPRGGGLRIPLEAYEHFRRQAFELLGHYVANDFQAAFHWLLAMRNAAPKRNRASVSSNPFHLGLLAMTAAAGEFMSRNKLRDLAELMYEAHEQEVRKTEFNDFVVSARRRARRERVSVSSERAAEIRKSTSIPGL